MRHPPFHALASLLDFQPILKQVIVCILAWLVAYAPRLLGIGASGTDPAGDGSMWVYVQFLSTFTTILMAMSVAARAPASATLLLVGAGVAFAMGGDWQTLLVAAPVCLCVSLLARWIRGLHSPAISPAAHDAGHELPPAPAAPGGYTMSSWTTARAPRPPAPAPTASTEGQDPETTANHE